MSDRDDLAHALDRFSRKADELLNNNRSAQTVTINAGGVGVWLCLTACVVMLSVALVAGVVGSQWLAREFGRIDVTLSERKEEADRMQTYLSAIYAQAPHLKPEEATHAERRSDHSESTPEARAGD